MKTILRFLFDFVVSFLVAGVVGVTVTTLILACASLVLQPDASPWFWTWKPAAGVVSGW